MEICVETKEERVEPGTGARVETAAEALARRDFEFAMAEKEEHDRAQLGSLHKDVVNLEQLKVGERFRIAGIPYITGKIAFQGAGSVTVDYDTVFLRHITGKGEWKTKMWRSGYRINIAPGTRVLPVTVRSGIWGGVPSFEGYPLYRSVWDVGEDIVTSGDDNASRLWGGVAVGLGRQRERVRVIGDEGVPAIGSERYGEGEDFGGVAE